MPDLPDPAAGSTPGRAAARRAVRATGAARARVLRPAAAALPVARVAVDSGLAHLDRAFDYAVTADQSAAAQPGVRVRVRFAGRLVDGLVLERATFSDHDGALAPLASVVGAEPVLGPDTLALCRAVAERYAGGLWDVLRLAVPPRHARVEAEPPVLGPQPLPPAPAPGSWSRYPTGPAFLAALTAGRSPRAVWSALPGPDWPAELATALRACAAGGRGAIAVLPDARDLDRLSAALGDLDHVVLRADAGPARRYRAFLRARRGQVRVVIGTRAAAFAPVADLGLVAVWDDGDDLHAEPRAPYPQVREVLVLRAHLAGAAALVGGFVRTAESQLLLDSGWARPLAAERTVVRQVAPRVQGTSSDDLARDPAARSARIPGLAFEAARAALGRGTPVLVQVPRRGYVPALACPRDSTPARCPVCEGPLQTRRDQAIAHCLWCGHLAADWRCPACHGSALRAQVVGAQRTAEELGRAFPGTPVRTSGREEVLATVAAAPALVVCTPGAEPVAEGGYGAVLLLDAWVALGRAELRSGEEALRRWFAAAALARPAGEGGRVVVIGDQALPAVQHLVRWDPAGAARRELDERGALRFPPVSRMAAVDGPAQPLAEVAAVLEREGWDVLGPVTHGQGERLLVRTERSRAAELSASLRRLQAGRSARKAPAVRVEVDPRLLV